MSPAGPAGRLPLRSCIDSLPQKPPFLFVDGLERLESGRSAEGWVDFREGHPVFENHLPGDPLVPGVILIEALAQLSGLILLPPAKPEPVKGYLGEVVKVRFRRKVRPGERVTLRSSLLRRFAGAARFAVEASVGGEIAADGELVLAGGTVGKGTPAQEASRSAPRVLFVCVENAGRSQMAEAFALSLGMDARSCGSKPGQKVNPLAVEAMREKGIDISSNAPKGFDQVPRSEIVVTMGCGDACPYVPGLRRDWDLPDPRGKDLAEVRKIRDEIERRVHALHAELKT